MSIVKIFPLFKIRSLVLETILFRGEMTYSYYDIQEGVEF